MPFDPAFWEAELQRLREAVARLEVMTLETYYNEPEKPREGRSVIADGSDWDPLSRGVPTAVMYLSGAWTDYLGATGPQGNPGADGDDGLSVYVANVFKRSATAPGTPSADDGQYNFSTNVLTPPSGWSVEPPGGTDPLYVSTGSFSVIGQTDTDTTVTWTTPDLLVSDGDPGDSIIVANVYIRSASAPGTPTEDDGSYNFGTKVLTPPSGWSATPPAGSDPLYVSTGTFSISGTTGTDNTVVWTSPDLLVQDGADGAAGGDGDSVFVGNVFLRKSTAPTKPIDNDGSYNFTTNVLTAPSTGGGSADDWSTTVPAGSDPLYICSGSFEINGVTGTDNTVVWSTPVIISQDGATGASGGDGSSVFVGSVFLRKASAPTEPIDNDGSYNFTTNVLTPPSITGGSADDWFIAVPAGSDPLYVCTGSFEIVGATGTDNTVDWTAPVVLASDGADGGQGDPGGDGDSIHVGSAFLRKATAPTKPIDDDGSYNFTTNVLTPPSTGGGSADDWSDTVPAGTDPLYVVNGAFEINGITGTDNTVVWSTPVILASDGADGADGTDAVVGYLTNDSQPVPHDYEGNNGDFTDANGEFKVISGTTDVSSSATFSEQGETNVTGQINTTVDEFFTGPKGAYRVTAMSADTGQYSIRAVYSGATIDKVFSVSKQLAAPPEVLLDLAGPIQAIGAGNQTAGIRFNSDGTIDKFTTLGGFVSFGTWIEPTSAASSAHSVREESFTGDPWLTAPAGVGVWIDLGTNRLWEIRDTDPSGINNESRTPTFEINKNAGAALTSDSVSCFANRTS